MVLEQVDIHMGKQINIDVYQFPRADAKLYHQVATYNGRNLFCHNSGSLESEIQVSIGLVLSGSCEGESSLCLS